MFLTEEDFHNIVKINLKDIKDNHVIRTIFTENPEAFLKMYTFAQKHNIEINIEGEIEDKYDNTIGTIEDISIIFGDKYTYSQIDIIVEVRDYL